MRRKQKSNVVETKNDDKRNSVCVKRKNRLIKEEKIDYLENNWGMVTREDLDCLVVQEF